MSDEKVGGESGSPPATTPRCLRIRPSSRAVLREIVRGIEPFRFARGFFGSCEVVPVVIAGGVQQPGLRVIDRIEFQKACGHVDERVPAFRRILERRETQVEAGHIGDRHG